jgi:hypothetical protein
MGFGGVMTRWRLGMERGLNISAALKETPNHMLEKYASKRK